MVAMMPRNCIRGYLSTIFLVALPAAAGVVLMATPIVRLSVGPQWLEIVPVIQLMAGAYLITCITQLTTTVLNAYALLARLLQITILVSLLRMTLLAILLPGGSFVNAAIAIGLASCCEAALGLRVMTRHFRLQLRELLRRLWRPAVAAGVMSITLLLTQASWTAPADGVREIAGLLVLIGFGAMVYSTVLLALWHASGRPRGAESDLLLLMHRVLSRWSVRWRLVQ